MSWLKTIAADLLHLVVEDWRYALSIALWILLASLVLPRLGIEAGYLGPILFLGLALILVESARRKGRASRRP